MNKSLLSISLDTNIANPKYGDALARQKEYAKYFDNYTIIILNTKKTKLKKELHFKNLNIYTLNSFSKYLFIFDALKLIKKINKIYHFDLVSSQDPLITGLIAYLTKLILKIPFNLQIHSTFCFDENIKFNPFLSLLIYNLVSKADSIRAVIPNLTFKNKFVKHIPLIIDLDHFYQKIKKRNNILNFIFIGRLAKEKNLELLIKSFSEINQKYPKIFLTIIGNGPEKNKIKQMIANLNLHKNAKLTGFLPKEKIKQELQNNDCLLLTSHYEGWPAVIMEAGAAGVPIISSNVGGINKIIKNQTNGLLFESNNLNQLIKQIDYLINNPNKAYEFAKNNQEYIIKKFSKQKLLKEWINLLQTTNFH